MSSHIALVATEPVRASNERLHRSDDGTAFSRPGLAKTTEQKAAPVKVEASLEEKSAPELEVAVAAVRHVATDLQRELQFSVDEASGRTIITVIDRESGKIIRQIPPEELLQIADRITAGGKLNLIDSRA